MARCSNALCCGSPPRRRGGRRVEERERLRAWLTPASAGRTPRPPPRTSRSPAHPRVGGADPAGPSHAPHSGGSPPRRRGGPSSCTITSAMVRLTPASAGRTASRSPASRSPAAHPRVGGADAVAHGKTNLQDGSPPRRRGGLHAGNVRLTLWRLTPASAGRTLGRHSSGCPPTAHPRVGGADLEAPPVMALWYGSPPRRRGGRRTERSEGGPRRLTPASAGRTPR